MIDQRQACEALGINAVCIMPEMTEQEKHGSKFVINLENNVLNMAQQINSV